MTKFADATTLEWVTVDAGLTRDYKFFLNVEKIKAALKNLHLDAVPFVIHIEQWSGSGEIGALVPLCHYRNEIPIVKDLRIYIRLSKDMPHWTEEMKKKKQLEDLPETLHLIANDILRHELAHIEDDYGYRHFVTQDREEYPKAVTAAFIQDLRTGKKEPLIIVEEIGLNGLST